MNDVVSDRGELSPTSGLAIFSMIVGVASPLSCVGFVLWMRFSSTPPAVPFFPLSVLMGIVAVILGLVALTLTGKYPRQKGKGMAVVGVVGGGIMVMFAAWAFIGVLTGYVHD
jgi:hypothetical protein